MSVKHKFNIFENKGCYSYYFGWFFATQIRFRIRSMKRFRPTILKRVQTDPQHWSRIKYAWHSSSAGVLLVRFEWVNHVTHSYKTQYQYLILYQYGWALEFPYSTVYSTNVLMIHLGIVYFISDPSLLLLYGISANKHILRIYLWNLKSFIKKYFFRLNLLTFTWNKIFC